MEFGVYRPGLSPAPSLTGSVVLGKSLNIQSLSVIISKMGILIGYYELKEKASTLLQTRSRRKLPQLDKEYL